MTEPGPRPPLTGPAPSAGRGDRATAAQAGQWRPGGATIRRWHAELAWLPGDGVRPDVLIEAEGDRFSAVTAAVPPAGCPPA